MRALPGWERVFLFSEVLEISYFPFVGRFQTLQTFSISWPGRTEMWSLVWAAKAICLGLFSEEAWGRHPTAMRGEEGVPSVPIGTGLLLRQLFPKFLLICVANCILGTRSAGPQRLCMCVRYYIHLPRAAGYLKQSCWCWLTCVEISFPPDFK